MQIQQVLLNLIINALEAMTVGEEPRELLISSRKSEKGRPRRRAGFGAWAGTSGS